MPQNGNAEAAKDAEGPALAVVRSGGSDVATDASGPSTRAAVGFSALSEGINSGPVEE